MVTNFTTNNPYRSAAQYDDNNAGFHVQVNEEILADEGNLENEHPDDEDCLNVDASVVGELRR